MASEALSDEAIMHGLQEHPRIRHRVACCWATCKPQGDNCALAPNARASPVATACMAWAMGHRGSPNKCASALAVRGWIGSGEIESAHRYSVQKRLKLPSTWCLAANAEHMLALRVHRANKEWVSYWATDLRYAA